MMEFEDMSLEINDQFTLGSEIMMAPVFQEKLTKRDVYFPPKCLFRHYFTKEVIDLTHETVGQTKTIDCPLGTPAVYWFSCNNRETIQFL